MADGNIGLTRRTSSHVAEAYVPPSAWTEDSNGRYLLIDLPGFKKEEVRLEVASTGRIIISGERLVGTDKCVFFEQDLPLPEDADVDNISGKFDGELLYISVPKKQETPDEIKEEHHQESIVPHGSTTPSEEDGTKYVHGGGRSNEVYDGGRPLYGFPPETVKTWAKEKGQLEEAMKLLKDNKGMVVALVLAFSLGVYVSQKFGTA